VREESQYREVTRFSDIEKRRISPYKQFSFQYWAGHKIIENGIGDRTLRLKQLLKLTDGTTG